MSNTGSAVATITSGANTPNPSFVLNSYGTFYIEATVSPSLNYAGTTLTSLQVTVNKDIPTIVFSSTITSQSPYTYLYEESYEFTGGAARITNNTGQTLIYSIVTTGSTITSLSHSPVATIDPTGCFLNTVSCGTTGTSTFRIGATADVSSNGDFGPNTVLSDILTITQATATILQYPQITLNPSATPPVTSSTLVYGQSYTITPDPSQISTITSNTDTNPYPNINYTSSDATIATISGTTVTIKGIGHFHLLVTVSPTTNYYPILRSPSTQIYDTIQAEPTIQNFPTTALSAQTWVYGQQYPGIIPPIINISTTNTDGPLITYSTSDATIATISGNTITIVGVGQFQILVTVHATTNFSAVTYTYPSGSVDTSGGTYTSYQTIPTTPIIKFLTNFTTSSRYGSTYVFVPPSLTNNDPSQSLTYSVSPANSPVATINGSTSSPSFVINSVGTFQIQASCGASTNGYYSALPLNPLSPILSPPITISLEMPIIVFNTANFLSQYTCQPASPYSFSGPIASITNNNVQVLTYSIVATDGVTPSTIATISSNGISLTTNSVGFFQILATATATTNGDYGGNTLASETITIISATPTITAFPTIPSPLIYGNIYTIPYSTSPPYTITTTNTDTSGPSITYSSTNSAVATISGSVTCSSNSAISSITGTTITIVGVGDFQITVTIGATANYNAAPYTYPSPTTWYTAIQATPTITLPSNLDNGWVIGGTYKLTSSVTTNAGSGYTDPNQVTYSFVTNNNSVKMVAVGYGGTNSIAYSNDGINWTGIGIGVISSGSAVAWNGNIWVVSSTSSESGEPSMVFSFNGINWFPVNNVVLTVINDIASSGPMWVAVGRGGVCNIAYSYDGIYWYNASASASNIFTNVNGVAWNGTIWVAVGSGQNSLAYSSDGINWNVTGTSTNTFNTAYDVAWNGAMWVAVGEVAQYTIAYSNDGMNWTGVSNSASSIFTSAGQGIAWNGSIWVAAGQGNNSMAYSQDGVNWTGSSNSTGIITGFGVHVAWSGSLWVVVGTWNNSSGYTMAYSSDGNNWIGVTNSVSSIFPNGSGLGIASTALIPNTIASLPNTIVAGALNPLVGGGNTIFYSNDGMNWNPAYGTNNNSNSGTIFSSQCAGVAWNGSMWVAVGAGVNTIAYSINGQYWYPSNNSVNIFSAVSGGAGVAWNGSMWVAVGSGPNTIAYSPDGINWTGSNNSTTIFSSSSVGGNDVAWNGSMWVAVGYGTNNTIAYSTDGINWTGSNYSTSIFSNCGNGIAWNGDMWVAVGNGTNNTIAWSNDGIGWSQATNSIGGGISKTIFSSGCGIAWNGSIWVAVGDGSGTNNTIAYSYDGKEWTGVGNSIFLFVGSGVTWYSAYNIWVATGSGNNNIAYSSDGIHWSPVNNSASIYEGMAIASTSDVVFYTNTGNNDNNASFPSSTQIAIKDVGSFQIQASLSGSTNFLSAVPVISNIITISPSTVSLTYNFANAGYVYGGTYTLPANPTNNTDTNPPPTIIYGITTQSNSTGSGSIGGNTLTTTAAGGVYISITVSATQNFNAASFSAPVTIAQATPVVVMNSAWITAETYSFTIGSVFGVYSLISSNSNTDVGLTYSLSPSISNGIGTVSIENNETVYCNAPGIFSLQVTSNATANFIAYSFQTPAFYVSVVPEVIIFNNPGTWPPNAQISGEVGMAICITENSYPFGFNNYSALTITNSGNGATFTLNANTSPTYNSVIYKYMVFFEPNTANTFSTALSTSTASNIVYVGTNSLAGGVVSGQDIIFTFSGNTVGQGYPDPLIINWNPGSIDITQGWVYGAFYSYANNITISQNLPSGTGVTVSTLMSGSIAGYFIAPWAGYDTISVTGGVPALNTLGYTALEQAWGAWVNINAGDQFGSTLTSDNVHYYYVGIPQITNPVTYH
uniref:Uncharacterized protein n=1 Tax=viral metagenome TaxID=1070528 RepID=A0A6C0EXL5_9ZZZZ